MADDLTYQNDASLNSVQGCVHSIETFGTVDGPGTRFVVFMQGCPLRCQFCHNPDTWARKGGQKMTVSEILAAFEKNRAFYRQGGITCTGGEPLWQPEFVGALFEAAHKAERGRIHTCLDTSGGSWNPQHLERYERLLGHTDLVLLDIKHVDPEQHKILTKYPVEGILNFADELNARKIPMVIRHVLTPGFTDSPEEHEALGRLMARWSNVVGLELLPYHKMGIVKYEELGIEYPLMDTPEFDSKLVPEIRQRIIGARRAEIMRLRNQN